MRGVEVGFGDRGILSPMQLGRWVITPVVDYIWENSKEDRAIL